MYVDPPMNVLTSAQPDLAWRGNDHHWFPWSPIHSRPAANWPNGARTAVSIVVNLSAVEWETGQALREPRPDGGRGLGAPPDVPRMSHREFGHRVGVFRLLDLFAQRDVPVAVVLDVMTAECYPALRDTILAQANEIICGGMSGSRPITSAMTQAEEADYIGQSLERLTQLTGVRPAGWLSPNRSESRRTPALLAAAGVEYVCDWANDEIPYPFQDSAEGLWAYPLSWELSDLATHFLRDMNPSTWADSTRRAFDTVHQDGGRTFGLELAPWISGQAYRTSFVDMVTAHITGVDGVWVTTPRAVVDAYRRQTTHA